MSPTPTHPPDPVALPDGPAAGFLAYRAADARRPAGTADLTVELAGAGTLRGLDACLRVACARAGLAVAVDNAPYGQLDQTVLGRGARPGPRALLLVWDAEWLLGDALLDPYAAGPAGLAELLAGREAHLHRLLDAALADPALTVLACSFVPPAGTALGILEWRRADGLLAGLAAINRRLAERCAADPRCWLVPAESVAARFGLDRWSDAALRLHGDIRIRPDALPWLAEAAAGILAARAGRVRKCLVLDADGILWGGVLGEDGPDGVQLGPDGAGRAFQEFQRAVLALHRRGVILAICSRNDPADIERMLADHPGMILRPDHISARRIGWGGKAEGVRGIAAELNLGSDALVFIDDDPANRLAVRGALPGVLVPEPPAHPAEYAAFVRDAGWFPSLQLTAEDLAKGAQYAAQAERERYRAESGDLGAFLAGLATVVAIAPLSPATRARAAQLCVKTNQFNTTLERLDEAALETAAAAGAVIRTVQVSDRFGDHGLTGLVVAEPGPGTWRIRLLLLSCRVLGRMVEHAVLHALAAEAGRAGATALAIPCVAGPRNQPAREFLAGLGLEPLDGGPGVHGPLSGLPGCPSHLRLELT